jgi:hypothetical protein
MSATRSRSRHQLRTSWQRRSALCAAIVVLGAGGTLVGLSLHTQHDHDAAVTQAADQRQAIAHRAANEADSSRSSVRQVTDAGGSTTVTAVSAITGTGATLVIPALGVRAPIVVEGATKGSMTIPSDISTVGWYDGLDGVGGTHTATQQHTAPWPGQAGVAVLAGHVDWAGQGPGALYYLDQLQPGDPISVVGSNGVTTNWSVSQVPITQAKATLPATLFTNAGAPRLALVTCGGAFDASTGHYLDNVIVWASPA